MCVSGQLGVRQVNVTCAGLPVVTDAVDDVVRHFGVLRHGQDVVAGDGGGVPHQEHTVSLALEERDSFLAAQPPPVPARSVFGIKITSHGGDTKSRARLEAFPLRLFLSATHTKTLVGQTAAAEKKKKRINTHFSGNLTGNFRASRLTELLLAATKSTATGLSVRANPKIK